MSTYREYKAKKIQSFVSFTGFQIGVRAMERALFQFIYVDIWLISGVNDSCDMSEFQTNGEIRQIFHILSCIGAAQRYTAVSSVNGQKCMEVLISISL